ncbi:MULTISPECIES: hypothetical protein [Streptomyces]|uniref:Uncharacterized protein n=1 Tax=Streptomyces nymphaeiformis TaxID=2663842 RepID=A0A7W7TWZ1_9ACTN|nr:hypothetical protein [Streptomyces nymphaeiformis]MBB4980904.1 hypothetical protein [Streptomyces nymphaeiformis]
MSEVVVLALLGDPAALHDDDVIGDLGVARRGDRTPGNTRRTLADALATITPALVRREARHSE